MATGPLLTETEREDRRQRRLLTLLLGGSIGLELVYLWTSMEDWQREIHLRRWRGYVLKVLKPCHDCLEHQKAVRETMAEATEVVMSSSDSPADG